MKQNERFGRPHAVTAAFCASFLVLGVNVAALGPLLLSLASALDVSLATAGGVLLFVRAAGVVSGSVLAGRVVERWPAAAHRFVALALLLVALGGLAAAAARSLAALAASQLVAGLGLGALDAAANEAQLREWRSAPARLCGASAVAMQALHAFFAGARRVEARTCQTVVHQQ